VPALLDAVLECAKHAPDEFITDVSGQGHGRGGKRRPRVRLDPRAGARSEPAQG
jgi:hypothetical protein